MIRFLKEVAWNEDLQLDNLVMAYLLICKGLFDPNLMSVFPNLRMEV